jgi:hypothetical protein
MNDFVAMILCLLFIIPPLIVLVAILLNKFRSCSNSRP